MIRLNENMSEDLVSFLEYLGMGLDFYACIDSYKIPLSPARRAIYEAIHEAFRGVTCKNEPAVLIGSAAKDDYLCGADIAYLSQFEEREHWEHLSPQWLYACIESLCYAGPEAYRFLIPAYMCASMEYVIADRREFEFYISCDKNRPEGIAAYRRDQGGLLNKSQREVVSDYLRQMWCDEHQIDYMQSINCMEYVRKFDDMSVTIWELDEFSKLESSVPFDEYLRGLMDGYITRMRQRLSAK